MKDLLKNKKGMSLDAVPSVVIIFVIIAVVLGVGATLLTDIQSDQTSGTYAYNATGAGLEGLDTISGWQDNMALIAVFGVILVLIGGFLLFKKR